MRELFFGLHQQLALVLGPKAELLPHSVKEEMQEAEHFPNLLFQFSTEDVTPICHSLEHLSAKKPKYQANESINGASSSAAFLLRHFSLLKKLNANQNLADVNVGTNIAICGLKELLTVPNQVTKILRRGLEWSLYARPPETLNLTCVTAMISLWIFESTIAMCPHLKVLHFMGRCVVPGDEMSSQELQFYLSLGLPQVDALKFQFFKPEYRAVVLSTLGAQIKSLKLNQCEDVNLANELMPCTQLQELKVKNCIMKPTPMQPEQNSTIRKLSLTRCVCSPLQLLALPIPSLTELYMTAVIIPSVDQSFWIHLPRLYPNLQHLSVLNCQCNSPTFDDVRLIATQLPFIKSIRLWVKLLQSEEYKRAEELQAELNKFPSPIKLEFVKLNMEL